MRTWLPWPYIDVPRGADDREATSFVDATGRAVWTNVAAGRHRRFQNGLHIGQGPGGRDADGSHRSYTGGRRQVREVVS